MSDIFFSLFCSFLNYLITDFITTLKTPPSEDIHKVFNYNWAQFNYKIFFFKEYYNSFFWKMFFLKNYYLVYQVNYVTLVPYVKHGIRIERSENFLKFYLNIYNIIKFK